MSCSSCESWRLMPLRLASALCSNCSVVACSRGSGVAGPGEIKPGVGPAAASSDFTTIFGEFVRAVSDVDLLAADWPFFFPATCCWLFLLEVLSDLSSLSSVWGGAGGG